MNITHFPLRQLDRDAHYRRFFLPEEQHPAWPESYQFHFVYRFYAADLSPLYIGLSYGSPSRWHQHRKTAEWWPLAEYVAVSFYPSYEAIQVAEKAAIRNEQPRFNKAHLRGKRTAPVPLHGAAEAAAEVLFREATPDFVAALASLLGQPERFPQPEPPPPARFAEEGTP